MDCFDSHSVFKDSMSLYALARMCFLVTVNPMFMILMRLVLIRLCIFFLEVFNDGVLRYIIFREQGPWNALFSSS